MKISFGGRMQYRQNYRVTLVIIRIIEINDFRRGNFRVNFRSNQIYRGQNYRHGYSRSYRSSNYEKGRSRSREKSFQIMSEVTTEEVAVDVDQAQELVLIEIGLDVINVKSTIILQKTVQPQKYRRKQNK